MTVIRVRCILFAVGGLERNPVLPFVLFGQSGTRKSESVRSTTRNPSKGYLLRPKDIEACGARENKSQPSLTATELISSSFKC